jgi:hypothetical protein
MGPFHTPAKIAELLAVDVGKVIGWFKSGELIAHNVAKHRNSLKARW